MDPRLLIGLEEPDDAAVYQLADDMAVILTADFITPVVDDAYTWGAIAATNSMSDVYAMGGRPVIALNLVGLPKEMPPEVAQRVVQGGLDRTREAGALIVGGHTVQDEEPKFGMAVLGLVHPDRILRKGGAKDADRLILTKPIGSGLMAKCGKNSAVPEEHLAQAQHSMLTSNRIASEVAVEFGLKGATDITGFGLIGHATEMANASNTRFQIHYSKVPLLLGALDQAVNGGYWPSKTWENEEYFSHQVNFAEDLDVYRRHLLYSPETSGGLLLCVPSQQVESFLATLEQRGSMGWDIGFVETGAGLNVTL